MKSSVMSIMLELRPGEGGDDAKKLVKDLAVMYIKHAENSGVKVDIVEDSPSCLIISLSGEKDKVKPFLNESGGHRFQRVPPNEKRGRVHTSTVTCAVMEIVEEKAFCLAEKDIQIMTTKDSGPGGQHRNKTESCVVARHIPTGIEAKASAKCQHANRKAARALLEARVKKYLSDLAFEGERQERKSKLGSGMRGDKIRTYREQDDLVTCSNGDKYRLSSARKGFLPWLV